MIRINLLPVRAVKKQEAGKQQLALLAVALVVALAGNIYWYVSRARERDRGAAQVTSVRKEIAELDRIIGEVKNIKGEIQKLEEKLKVLDTLKKGRTGPVKLLDAMATAIPKNVWLKQMVNAGGSLALEGSAISNDDLAALMKALEFAVWTPEGMGRLVENPRQGATSSRVELTPSGQVKEFPVDKVGFFFRKISLKKSTLRVVANDLKVVDFALNMSANEAI
jgi:type IV pilus assembly protein PilN